MESYSKDYQNNLIRQLIWLECNMVHIKKHSTIIQVFGSAARKIHGYSDIDIVIVYNQEKLSIVKEEADKLKHIFFNKFKIPLSVVLLNKNEWIEFKYFFGPHRIFLWDK